MIRSLRTALPVVLASACAVMAACVKHEPKPAHAAPASTAAHAAETADPRTTKAATKATGAVDTAKAGVDPAKPRAGTEASETGVEVPTDLAKALQGEAGKGLTTPLSAMDHSDEPDFQPPADLPRYKGKPGIKGSVRAIGSITVGLMVQTWVRAYAPLQPDVRLEVTSGAAGDAFPALIAGQSDIAMLSRRPTPEELAGFKAARGFEASQIPLGSDALVIYVNRRNPLPQLTIDQVERIFGREPEGALPIERWGEVGLDGAWKDRELQVFGPRPSLGAWDVFQHQILRGRPFRASMKQQVVVTGIPNACGSFEDAIGFASRYYATRRTRIVPIAPRPDAPPVMPSRTACLAGTYPLARPMFLVIAVAPGKQPSPALQDFVRFLASWEGQEVSSAAGSFPITHEMAVTAYDAVGLSAVTDVRSDVSLPAAVPSAPATPPADPAKR